MTPGGVLEHARAVAFAITGVGTAYFGPFLGFKAAAQIALGASGTPGAQVAQTMLLARSLGRGGCPGQIHLMAYPLIPGVNRTLEVAPSAPFRAAFPELGTNTTVEVVSYSTSPPRRWASTACTTVAIGK